MSICPEGTFWRDTPLKEERLWNVPVESGRLEACVETEPPLELVNNHPASDPVHSVNREPL